MFLRKMCGAAAIACPVLLGACGWTRTPYQTPAVDMPATWKHGNDMPPDGRNVLETAEAPDTPKVQEGQGAPEASETSEAKFATMIGDGAWWRSFGDEALNRWVEKVLNGNSDLAQAEVRARREQLRADLAENHRLPGVAGQIEQSVSRGSHGRKHERKWASARLSFTYDPDPWGKLEREAEAAHWHAIAEAAEYADTALSQSYLAAKLYWELGYLNQRIEWETENVISARRTRDLVAARHQAGAISSLDVMQAEWALGEQEAALASLIQERVEARDKLAVLRGGAPGDIEEEPTTLPPGDLPAIHPGLPARLLAARPDLRVREARLRAALAETDATRAALYPSFTLTGKLGGASGALSEAISHPGRTLAAAIALPFLEWRQRRLKVGISLADYDERVLQFRDTLYKALAEVENLLSAQTQLRVSEEALERARQAAREAERLMGIRYLAGAAYLQQWLDAQEKWRRASSAYDENHLRRLLNQARLYQALGAGAGSTRPGSQGATRPRLPHPDQVKQATRDSSASGSSTPGSSTLH